MNHWNKNRAQTGTDKEDGNSTVEFIGAAAGLLIPALLLIVAVLRVQSAIFAAQASAQEVARTYSLARSVTAAHQTGQDLARLAFADHDLPAPTIMVACPQQTCQTPGDLITVTVTAQVPLVAVGNLQLGHFPVTATATSYLGQYVDRSSH